MAEFRVINLTCKHVICWRNLSHNYLDGQLPAEFGNLRSIQIMWVSTRNPLPLHPFQIMFFLYNLLHIFSFLMIFMCTNVVICHLTHCLVTSLTSWVNCRTLSLCKLVIKCYCLSYFATAFLLLESVFDLYLCYFFLQFFLQYIEQ